MVDDGFVSWLTHSVYLEQFFVCITDKDYAAISIYANSYQHD